MDIYQIKVREFNLIFSEESEYTGKVDDNNIFTNTYIYGDDTIVEVINKIKLAIIDSNKLEYKKFDELYGYLSSDEWNYYSDYKIQEYEKLVNNNNPINDTFYERINLNNDRKFINPNNLVIGYYARNNHNNYKYYINNTYFEELITNNNLLENEYNNPINTYKKYNEDYTYNNIKNFTFNINEEEYFKNFNKFNILNSKNTDGSLVDLTSIYEKIHNSKKYIYDNNNKLPTTKKETFYDIDLEDNNIFNLKINKLSLQIHSIKININLLELFENITLNENCPVCIYSYKDKKKHKKYKILKKDSIPIINLEDLKNIHTQSKKTLLNNNILFKIKFSNINYYFDLYILDEHYFYINFDFTTINNITNITLEDIITNINNVLEMFNLYVGNSNNISSLEQFFYFNNNNYIKIVNSNSHESININYTINLNYLGVKNDKYIIHNFINYIILFHTYFELTKESNQHFKMFNKNSLQASNVSIINETGIQFEDNKAFLKEFNDYIIEKQKIYFSYKKSYNYESYNYIVKFLREIMTNHTPNAMQKAILNFSPNTIKKIYTFLEFGEYEDDANYKNISETRLDLFKTFLNLYGYDNIDKLIYYRANTHSHQKNRLFVEGNILYFNISNIYSLNEFYNFKNTILEFIYFNNLIDNKLNDTSISIPLIDNSENIYMLDKGLEYKNIYNNIYNLYNNLIKLPKIQYYIYIYFYNYYKSISNKKPKKETIEYKIKTPKAGPLIKTKKQKKVSKSISTDKNPKNIGYKDLFEYKYHYCTQDNVEFYTHFFGKDYKSLCDKPKRPSIIPAEKLKQIQEEEQEDKIKLTNGNVIKYFTERINLDENIIDIIIKDNKIHIDKNDINKLVLGRLYIFNITINSPKYKFVLLNLFKLSDEYINYDNIIQEPNILEIYKNVDQIYTRITFDDYLLSTDEYFKFRFHYNHSIPTFIDNIIIGYLYETIPRSFPLDNKSIKKIQLNAENNSPKIYYYDLDRYKDNYFICLPNITKIGRLLDKDTYDVLYKQGTNDNGGLCCSSEPFHELHKIDDNYKKNVYNNKKKLNQNNFTVKHLKIATIPSDIYDKLCSFLNITPNENYYKNEDILFNQPYRIGFNTHKNIPNFITCLLDIYKYSTIDNKVNIKTKYPQIFTPKYYDKTYILNMLIEQLNISTPTSVFDFNFLKQLNEGMYINISNKTTEKECRDTFSKYISDNFVDLDIYLIWSLFSQLLNINIVIIEIEITSFIDSYIKCPNNNQYFYNLFRPNYKTCFILKLNNMFQPIIFQTKESEPHYTLLFDIKNSYSNNFRNMYAKCLLKYNDIDYNNALINSIYHGIDFMNYIVLFAEDFEKIKPYVVAIVINDNFIKLGLIIQFSAEDSTNISLFLPINTNKHEINYSSLFDTSEDDPNTKPIRYIYYSTLSNDEHNIISTIDETIYKFNEFYKIHTIDKLKLNKDFITYITDQTHIIGITLPTNDIIPVLITNLITDMELNEDNQLYTLTEFNKITDVDYNDFNYDKILYKYFIKYVSSKLSLEEVKSELNILLQNLKKFNTIHTKDLENEDKIAETSIYKNLREFIKKQINIITFNDHDQKFTENINMCHTITTNDKCINNCKFDKGICKYQIQLNKYELFLDRLIYDLVFNDYKKNLILNNLLSDDVTTITDDIHIFLDDNYINDYTFNALYNKTSIDNFFHILGINYNLSKQSYKNNFIYCSQEKTIMTQNTTERIYYQFKSVLKNNNIAYSNCIYYNLGKNVLGIEDTIVKTLRKNIANEIKNLIELDQLNFYEVIQTYLHENKIHIYNNININELYKLIQTDNHWLTLLDLFIISKLYNKEFHIYKYNKINKYVDTTKGFIIGKGDKVELFMTHFYYKQIFYLMKN